jgi:Tfp pilus assembly protein PilO
MMLFQVPAPTPPPTPDPVIVQTFPFPDPVAPPWVTLPPAVTVLIALAFIGGVVAIFWPLMRAIARRIEGKAKPDPALLEELDHLRSRVGELEAMQFRMAELEERVDFTERLLAQKSESRELRR